MNKDKRIVKWTERKVPSELEEYLFPNSDWSLEDKHHQGVVLETVLGVWNTFYVVDCTDGRVRRVDVKSVKEVNNGS